MRKSREAEKEGRSLQKDNMFSLVFSAIMTAERNAKKKKKMEN